MKRTLLLILTVLSLTSCKKNPPVIIQEIKLPDYLICSLEQVTKVSLDEKMTTIWNADDSIAVFYCSDSLTCWKFTGKTGEAPGTFVLCKSEEEDPALVTKTDPAVPKFLHNIGIYPYNENLSVDFDTYEAEVMIESTQYYVKDSYANGANLMCAFDDSDDLTFKNVYGYLLLELKADRKTVKSIVLTGNGDETLAGQAVVGVANLAIHFPSAGSKELTLDCGDGVRLNAADPTSFYFTIAPQTFQKGLLATINYADGSFETKSIESPVSITRNVVTTMADLEEGEQSTFEAPVPIVPAAFSTWGDAEIVAQYPVGPGVEYANVRYTGVKNQNVFIMKVDLQNEYNNLEQCTQKIPATKWATVPNLCASNSSLDGHRVIGAVNNDFFISSEMITFGPSVTDGMFYAPSWGCYAALAINAKKEAAVLAVEKQYGHSYDSKVIYPSGGSVAIACYNTTKAKYASEECHLFNSYYSGTTVPAGEAGCTYVSISNEGPFTVNGDPTPCTVLEVSKSPLAVGDNNFVLVFNDKSWNPNPAATYVAENIKQGDVLQIKQNFVIGSGVAPKNIVTAFSGIPRIVTNGAVDSFSISAASEPGTANRARTMMGLSKEKRFVYIVVVDGPEKSNISSGTFPREAAEYLVSIGCFEAVNFDGGGSSEMVLGSLSNTFTTMNVPSDGKSRSVANAAQVISTAPLSNKVETYSFNKSLITASQQLTVYGLSKYGDLVSTSLSPSDFTYTCTPSSIGSVNESGYFTIGTTKNGVITATKKGDNKVVAKVIVKL